MLKLVSVVFVFCAFVLGCYEMAVGITAINCVLKGTLNSKFALFQSFGYWLLQQLVVVLPYKP